MIYTTFINWSVFLFLFYEYLNNKFPQQTQEFLINLSYYCIYFFSKIQICLKNNKIYGKYLDEIIEIKEKLIIFVTNILNKNETSSQPKETNGFPIDPDQILFEFVTDNKVNFVTSKNN
jgi:hypothetical protein